MDKTQLFDVDQSVFTPDSSSSSGTDETITVGLSRHPCERREDLLNPELVPIDIFLMPQYTPQEQHLYTSYQSSVNDLKVRNHLLLLSL